MGIVLGFARKLQNSLDASSQPRLHLFLRSQCIRPLPPFLLNLLLAPLLVVRPLRFLQMMVQYFHSRFPHPLTVYHYRFPRLYLLHFRPHLIPHRLQYYQPQLEGPLALFIFSPGRWNHRMEQCQLGTRGSRYHRLTAVWLF